MNNIKLTGYTTEECYQIAIENVKSGKWKIIDENIYINGSSTPYPKKKNGTCRFNTIYGTRHRVDLSPKKIVILLLPPKICTECKTEFKITSNTIRNNLDVCHKCYSNEKERERAKQKAKNPIIEIDKNCKTCGEHYVITSKTVRENKEICVDCNKKEKARCRSFNDRSWKRIGQVTNDDGEIIYEYIERNGIIEKYNSTCACCGIKCHDNREHWTHDKMNMDHIVPIGLGGVHRKYNVQLLCNYCNSIKAIEDGWSGYALPEQQGRLMTLMVYRAEYNTRNRTNHIYSKSMKDVIKESFLLGLEIFVDLEEKLQKIKNVYDDDVDFLLEQIKEETSWLW